MMDSMFHGAATKHLDRLRKAVLAHESMMGEIAAHAEQERLERVRSADARRASQAVSGTFGGSGKSLSSDPAVCRDEPVWLLAGNLVGGSGLALASDLL